MTRKEYRLVIEAIAIVWFSGSLVFGIGLGMTDRDCKPRSSVELFHFPTRIACEMIQFEKSDIIQDNLAPR